MRSTFKLPFVRWLVPTAAGSIAALASATTVFAGTLAAGTPVQVSDHPFPGHVEAACDHVIVASKAAATSRVPRSSPMSPSTRGARSTWSRASSRTAGRGANGLINVVSNNGGASWTLATDQPQFSICEGATSGAPGFFQRASDAWVSIGPDGIAYSMAIAFNVNGPAFGGASGVIVSRSTDGVTTWQAPVTAEFDSSFTVS